MRHLFGLQSLLVAGPETQDPGYSHRLCTYVFNSLRFVSLVYATFVIIGIAMLILIWALEIGAIAIAPAHVDAAE